MIKQLRCLCLTWSLAVMAIPVVSAQITTAILSGTVKDESGAVLPGVSVTVKAVETGLSRSLITGDEGRYNASELPPGAYEVSALLAGFQTAVRTGINLTIGRHAVVDLVLKIGAMDEKVVVSGEAPLVETTSSALAGLVGEAQIRDLPLNGRNFVQLTLLETGVVQARSAGSSAVVGGGLKMSFHGARMDFNNYMMDGTNINSVNQEAIGGTSGQAMGVETIREFQVITSNFSAEFGRAGGGVINVVTKSGTNQFRGSGFYFHRNDNLDARNFFDVSRAPEFKRNQFGLTAGGPIRKDKTFIFGGYEGLREGLGQTLITTVPTAAAREGNLPSGAVTVAPVVKPYLALYPLPNSREFADGTAELRRADTQVTHQDFYQARVDHSFSEADSLFVRYTADDSGKTSPQAIPTWLQTDAVRSQYVTVEEKRIISPSLLNVFRFGFNRTAVAYLQTPLDSRVSNSSLWFLPNPSVPILGVLSVSGLGNPGGVQNRPRSRADNVFQWTDTISYNAGIHALKMGGEVHRIQTNEAETDNGAGNFSFANLRNFLLAQPANFTGATGASEWPRGWRQSLLGLFFQDDIRIRSNLTLNLGVRWEFTTNPSEVNGKASHIANPVADTTWVVGNPLIRFPKDNVAPRIGLAWDVSGDGKTSVRAGFGMYHQMIFRYWYWTSGNTLPPFIQRISTAAPFVSFPNPFAAGLSQQPARDMDLVEYNTSSLPYMMQYNLSVQRELMQNTVLTVGYVGSRGLHLGRFNDVNNAVGETLADGRKFFREGLARRNTAWAQVRHRTGQASSRYNGLQLKLARRLSAGLQFQTSYTWSHSTDDASGSLGGSFGAQANALAQDPYNLRAELGNSNLDLRQVSVTNFTYDLPLGRGLTGASARLLQGWQLTSIVSLTTGVPFTAENVSSLDRDRDRSLGASRPNLVAGRNSNPVLGGPDVYFDTSAFQLQDPGFYGNLGRNTLSGPKLAGWDFAIVKNLVLLNEDNRLQFRAEFFNLLNHPNFALTDNIAFRVATGVPSASAGRITQTVTTSRQIQFGLKFSF